MWEEVREMLEDKAKLRKWNKKKVVQPRCIFVFFYLIFKNILNYFYRYRQQLRGERDIGRESKKEREGESL